jgi:hypothetical protein
MQRLDASRCKTIAKSEGVEHTPTGNAETQETAKALVQ